MGDLKQYGRAQRAFLGIKIREITSDLAKKKLENISGVYVASIELKNVGITTAVVLESTGETVFGYN